MIENKKVFVFIILVIICCFSSCEDSYGPVSTVVDDPVYTKHGVFILNEGNYVAGNGSLSYYDIDSQVVSNNVFINVNEIPLGDVVQSMAIKDSTAFIVVNYSKKIEIINTNTYKQIATIIGFDSPRYMQIIDETKAYVTDLSSDEIQIININTFEIFNHISVGFTTEKLVKVENKVFVLNWSFGNKVLVIDTESDELTDTITVTKEPNSIVVDKNKNIWVLSSGGFMNDEIPALISINSTTHSITHFFEFAEIDLNPTHLSINGGGDTLYFLNDGVYKMKIDNIELPSVPVIYSNDKQLYSLKVHPERPLIFISDAIDFNQDGIVWVYNTLGAEIDHFKAGINPSGFYFK